MNPIVRMWIPIVQYQCRRYRWVTSAAKKLGDFCWMTPFWTILWLISSMRFLGISLNFILEISLKLSSIWWSMCLWLLFERTGHSHRRIWTTCFSFRKTTSIGSQSQPIYVRMWFWFHIIRGLCHFGNLKMCLVVATYFQTLKEKSFGILLLITSAELICLSVSKVVSMCWQPN